MKLTWFGGTTLRVYIGGEILVMDAPEGAGEIISGADQVFRRDDPLPDAGPWRPRTVGRLIDEEKTRVLLHRLGRAVLVDAVGEPPLILGEPPAPGRWSNEAVVVRFEAAEPLHVRLIVLAVDDPDTAIAALSPKLDGTGLVALERGMALEI